jgi:hypothetical protein
MKTIGAAFCVLAMLICVFQVRAGEPARLEILSAQDHAEPSGARCEPAQDKRYCLLEIVVENGISVPLEVLTDQIVLVTEEGLRIEPSFRVDRCFPSAVPWSPRPITTGSGRGHVAFEVPNYATPVKLSVNGFFQKGGNVVIPYVIEADLNL